MRQKLADSEKAKKQLQTELAIRDRTIQQLKSVNLSFDLSFLLEHKYPKLIASFTGAQFMLCVTESSETDLHLVSCVLCL